MCRLSRKVRKELDRLVGALCWTRQWCECGSGELHVYRGTESNAGSMGVNRVPGLVWVHS